MLSSRGVAVFALALLWLAAARPAPAEDAPAKAPARPDVLFIAVDDLNDWIGCLTNDRSPLAGGHPDTHTPHLDRLAARGTLFTNAHCAAPACNPSRLAVMTGLRPTTTGLYVNDQDWYAASQDVPVLTETFKNAGYRVRAGGKLFHGGNPGLKDERFWHEYLPLPGFPVPHEAKGGTANGLGRGHFDWAPLEVGDEAMGDTQLVDWATGVIKDDPAGDAPRFTAVGLYRPHLPWFVPQKYFDAVPENPTLPAAPKDDLSDLPPAGVRMAKPDGDHAAVTQADQWGAAVRAYLANIRYADGQVGRLLDALDASGRADNTIIVLWGDHGWHLGEKEHWRKFTLWERATRVPLMIVAPGVTDAGTRCDAPVELTSLFPTLCDLCGVAPAGEFDAPSLRPLLEDPDAAWEHVAVTTHGRGNTSVRGPRFRLIHYKDGGEELYDHAADPGEYRNLLTHADRPPAFGPLQKRLPTDYAPNAPSDKDRPKRRPQGR
ncbi:sulfatase [Alienimonas californiensis]|uniref:sulfatase n=1 Tax=Alienimonas californiensis TaxID=2527989 RepID=UPI001F61D454|nr:sulfatase [Alienimonas californiensis]